MSGLLDGFDSRSWLLATILGLIFLGLSALLQYFGRRRRAEWLLKSCYWVLTAFSGFLLWVAVLLLLGLTGPEKDNHRIWYGLALGGLIGVVAFALKSPGRWQRAGQEEERRIAALDL